MQFVPWAALAMAFIVLITNVLTQSYATREGWLPSVPRGLVNTHLTRMQQPADAWLLGSSTLARGIDEQQVKTDSGLECHNIALGSAGPVSLAELAIFGLNETSSRPQAIFLFVFKDSLNCNRRSFDHDLRYVQAMESPTLNECIAANIPLYSYRLRIRSFIRNNLADLFRLRGERRHEIERKVPEQLIDNPDRTYLMNNGRNYEIDLGRLSELAEICRSMNVDLYLVLTPTATAAFNWQAKHYPNFTWDDITEMLHEMTAREQIGLLDYTHLFPSTNRYFTDSYHLQSERIPEFSRQFSVDIRELIADPEQNTP